MPRRNVMTGEIERGFKRLAELYPSDHVKRCGWCQRDAKVCASEPCRNEWLARQYDPPWDDPSRLTNEQRLALGRAPVLQREAMLPAERRASRDRRTHAGVYLGTGETVLGVLCIFATTLIGIWLTS